MKAYFPLFVIVLSFSLSSVNATEDAETPTKEAVSTRRPRSIYIACREDYRRLCMKVKKGFKCLDENESQIKSETCRSWLGARRACNEAPACEGIVSKRSCLRSADRSSLPEACVKSDYYRSVIASKVYRARQQGLDKAKPKKTTEADAEK